MIPEEKYDAIIKAYQEMLDGLDIDFNDLHIPRDTIENLIFAVLIDDVDDIRDQIDWLFTYLNAEGGDTNG